uniref:Ground-like domain-containing protein n=1 Tax=Panagrolaimus sp. PS1159 TaxID=55785 RepID=A0AC35EU79_9BILA
MPPPCPPTFCPPPPLCPPPPPPPPPPMCPPPSPCGGGCGGGYAPAPIMPYQPPVPAFNDCCCQCGSPCRYRTMRARTHGAKIFSALSLELEEDPTCNSMKLRDIIEENITKDPTISKRAIQKAAEERLGSKINVICAKSDFSYVAYTETYCQASSGEVTCYAFKPQ